MGKRQLSGAVLTANLIKKRLTALYPRVKFSVTSDTFSMGDSVDIRWTDGPTSEAMLMVNSGPGTEDYIPPGKVYLIEGWIIPVEKEGVDACAS